MLNQGAFREKNVLFTSQCYIYCIVYSIKDSVVIFTYSSNKPFKKWKKKIKKTSMIMCIFTDYLIVAFSLSLSFFNLLHDVVVFLKIHFF